LLSPVHVLSLYSDASGAHRAGSKHSSTKEEEASKLHMCAKTGLRAQNAALRLEVGRLRGQVKKLEMQLASVVANGAVVLADRPSLRRQASQKVSPAREGLGEVIGDGGRDAQGRETVGAEPLFGEVVVPAQPSLQPMEKKKMLAKEVLASLRHGTVLAEHLSPIG